MSAWKPSTDNTRGPATVPSRSSTETQPTEGSVSGDETNPPATPETTAVHSPNWHRLSSSAAPEAQVAVATTFLAQKVTTSTVAGTAEIGKWDTPISSGATSLSNTPASAATRRSASAPLATPPSAPSEETVVTSSFHPEPTDSPSVRLRAAQTSPESPSTVVKSGSDAPLSFPSVKTSTAVSRAKMETDEIPYSSGSPPAVPVPGETSTGTWASATYVTLPDPRVTSSAPVSSSHLVKELRTADTSARTEATSPATHARSPQVPRTPSPVSLDPIAGAGTDTAGHFTGSHGTGRAEKSPGFGTQSTLGPVSVVASASPTSGSSVLGLTSDASGESLTLTTSNENTAASWLWALTTSLPMATWLRTSSTQKKALTAPETSSPSSSETTFATFTPSVPSRELANVGVDTTALQNTDSTTMGATHHEPQSKSVHLVDSFALRHYNHRYHSLGDERQHRVHTPSGTDHFGTQEKTHISGNKTSQLCVSRGGKLTPKAVGCHG
ncbi:mucin-16-like [Crocuta crocuta]